MNNIDLKLYDQEKEFYVHSPNDELLKRLENTNNDIKNAKTHDSLVSRLTQKKGY